jgi:hypothetical protein
MGETGNAEMRKISVDVIGYEHEESNPGIWHIRLLGYPDVLRATNPNWFDGRPLIGKQITGILRVEYGHINKVADKSTSFAATPLGGYMNSAKAEFRGQLVAHHKVTDGEVHYVVNTICPIYVELDEADSPLDTPVGEWVEGSGYALFDTNPFLPFPA